MAGTVVGGNTGSRQSAVGNVDGILLVAFPNCDWLLAVLLLAVLLLAEALFRNAFAAWLVKPGPVCATRMA